MRPERILELLRPLVLVCDRDGFIREAHGGFGGVAGLAAGDLVGRHALELLSDDDAVSLASVFLQGADRDDFTVPQPIPFVVHVVSPDGGIHPADVIATGVVDGDEPGWIVVITPHDQHTTPVPALTELLNASPLRRILTAAVDHLSGSGADGRRLAAALVVDGVDGLHQGRAEVLWTALPETIVGELERALAAPDTPIRTSPSLHQLRGRRAPRAARRGDGRPRLRGTDHRSHRCCPRRASAAGRRQRDGPGSHSPATSDSWSSAPPS